MLTELFYNNIIDTCIYISVNKILTVKNMNPQLSNYYSILLQAQYETLLITRHKYKHIITDE